MKYLIILLLFISCNEKYPPPMVELCTTDDGTFACNDLRKPKKEQTYTKLLENNYICINPKDYDRMFAYCSDQRKERIKCEKKLK